MMLDKKKDVTYPTPSMASHTMNGPRTVYLTSTIKRIDSTSVSKRNDKAGNNATLLGSMAIALLFLEMVNDASASASLRLMPFASSSAMRVAKFTVYLNGRKPQRSG